jgi:hypothetical protein
VTVNPSGATAKHGESCDGGEPPRQSNRHSETKICCVRRVA